MNSRRLGKWVFLVLVAGLWSSPVYCELSSENAVERQAGGLSIVMKPVKRSYKSGEAISLAVAVANHHTTPVYIPVNDPEIFDPYFQITDANGVVVSGVVNDDPNKSIPGHYFIQQRDGKSILVFPVLEVKGHGLILTFIPNVLKRHQDRIVPGRYYLRTNGFPVIVKAGPVMSRQDYPQWLWINQEFAERALLVKHEPIEIIVRESEPEEKPLGFGPESKLEKMKKGELKGSGSFFGAMTLFCRLK